MKMDYTGLPAPYQPFVSFDWHDFNSRPLALKKPARRADLAADFGAPAAGSPKHRGRFAQAVAPGLTRCAISLLELWFASPKAILATAL